MIDARTAPYAALLLRLGLGCLFLVHAESKMPAFVPVGASDFLSFYFLSIAWELFGAVALILGFMPRLIALASIPVLVGSILIAHGVEAFFFGNPIGGYEFLALWMLALLAQVLIGDGAFLLAPTPIIYGWSLGPAGQKHRERLRRTRSFAQ